ncbi:hypothetical protein D3C76_1144970 [compost metagenome]
MTKTSKGLSIFPLRKEMLAVINRMLMKPEMSASLYTLRPFSLIPDRETLLSSLKPLGSYTLVTVK